MEYGTIIVLGILIMFTGAWLINQIYKTKVEILKAIQDSKKDDVKCQKTK